MTGELIIGVDAGTSVIKAVAFDLQGRQLDLQRVGRLPGRLLDALHPRLERLDALVNLLVELARAHLDRRVRDGVGEVLGRLGARALGRDGDQVALGDRLGCHVLEQIARAAIRAELLLGGPAHVDRGDEAGGGGDVARRVAGGRDLAQGRKRAVVARHGGDEHGRARLVGLLGGAHVESGGQRGDEHHEDDQLEPLADGLDVAAKSLLLARRDQPFGGLCLAGVDQVRSEVPREPQRILGRTRASCGSGSSVVGRRRTSAVTLLLIGSHLS